MQPEKTPNVEQCSIEGTVNALSLAFRKLFLFFFIYHNRASKNRFNEAKVGKQGILSANFTFTGATSFLQSTLAFCSITNPCRVLE